MEISNIEVIYGRSRYSNGATRSLKRRVWQWMRVVASLFKITHNHHAFFHRTVALYNITSLYTDGIQWFLQRHLKPDTILHCLD